MVRVRVRIKVRVRIRVGRVFRILLFCYLYL